MSDNPKFCEECGASLTNAIKFCTNCGAKINDLQADENEKITEKTTKQEFLTKYYGKKILDHIDDINKCGIGDKNRLYSIYKIIENKELLTDEDFEYLKKCSDEFNAKIGINSSELSSIIKQKEINFKKKGIPTRFKILGIIGIIIIFSVIIGYASHFIEEEKTQMKIEQKSTQVLEKNAIEFVQNYQGTDGIFLDNL